MRSFEHKIPRSSLLGKSDGIKLRNFSFIIIVLGIIGAMISDIGISASNPWQQLYEMLVGLIQPEITDYSTFYYNLVYTVCFALLGVSVSVVFGLFLSLLYHLPIVRVLCAAFRAIHELFWALIFIQLFGLSATSAILAIAIPYACTFARVFDDIYQQAPISLQYIDKLNAARFSYFIYVLFPQVWTQMSSYLRYRFECGVRSSAVLGFVGLPTIGFHLEIAFKQGDYSYAGALLLGFYLLIASMKYWMKLYLLPVYLLLAGYFVPTTDFVNNSDNIIRFFTEDIWPRVVREESLVFFEKMQNYLSWLAELLEKQAIEGMLNTVLLTVMAVACTAVFCVLLLPILVAMQRYWSTDKLGGCFLLVMRSTPEYVLAFILLLIFGPSMLPAVIALAIHNSGLIGFLLERQLRSTMLVNKAGKNIKLSISFSEFLYQYLPSIYMNFISLLMYRSEIILRESAILGMLGITTLGFYIDSAFEDLRFDRAFALLILTAALNVILDQVSRKMQRVLTDKGVRVRSKD